MGVGLDKARHDETGLYVGLGAGGALPDTRNRAILYLDEIRTLRVRPFAVEYPVRTNPQLSHRFLPIILPLPSCRNRPRRYPGSLGMPAPFTIPDRRKRRPG